MLGIFCYNTNNFTWAPERWRQEKASWLKIDKIPDEMLPAEVVAEEGGY